MNKVIIEVNSNETSAKVTQHLSNSRVAVKNIPIAELPTLIRNSAANTQKDSDTGYMSPNLIREVIAHGQVRRLYLYPTLTFECKVRAYFDEDEEDYPRFNEENSYGIKFIDEHLVFPDFTFRNFGLMIANVNNEEFSCVRHNFGCISTDFFDHVHDQSKLYFAMLNHFDQRVCWHGSFDQSLLNERNTTKQGKLVYNYLNSNFNSDLYLRNVPSDAAITKYRSEGLEDFLCNVFSERFENILEQRNMSQGVIVHVAILYYFTTKLNLKVEDCTEPSSCFDDESETTFNIEEYM